MKIWNSYGSEHSANLVMIGSFRTKAEAEDANNAIEQIKEYLSDSQESYEDGTRFSKPLRELLMTLKVYTLAPREIDQFNYDARAELKDDRIVITTEESDFSAFLKILIEFNAKVEVYSAHTYTGTGEGR
ncbi:MULTISPECIES: DUF6375 family protein [Sphingobacterium]|uniref:DUF6375 family protein n=1 Tax=Sphingobacterium TaxID=28453 RepID=UPI0013DCD3E4|nr:MULTISPECIES: DUF6375 family protein [unclassified Sphingobacterium]